MTQIKFCGLKTGRDVAAAEAAGAAWTGFVIFEKSPRHVSPSLAGEMAHLAKNSQTVAVTVNPDDDLLARIRDAMHPDWIQLHGSESPQRVVQARAYAKRGVVKALPVADASDLDAAKAYDRIADMLLFDATPPTRADQFAVVDNRGAAFVASLRRRLRRGRAGARRCRSGAAGACTSTIAAWNAPLDARRGSSRDNALPRRASR